MSRPALKAVITPERLAEVRAAIAEALAGETSKTSKSGKNDDDVLREVRQLAEALHAKSEQVQRLKSQLKAKETEHDNALQEAQALTHLGSWQWDVASNAITWSDELYRIYGLRPGEREIGFEEFIGLIHADDRERVQRIIGTAFESATSFEFEHRIVLPNGAERILYGMGKVVADAAGEPVRMVGTSQDVTDHRQVESALRESDRRFQAMTRASHDLVYDLDLRHGNLWCNEALATEYGYPTKGSLDLSREWWDERVHPEDAARLNSQFRKLLAGKQTTWDTEYRFRRADGTYADIRNRASVLRDTDGKAERLIGSFLDVTKQKQLDRAKDEFLSLASHQLRTPLTVIRMYSEMLADGMVGKITPKQQEHTHHITEASVRLINLVGEMLTISRLELDQINVAPVPTDVTRLIRTYVQELLPVAEAKDITITFAATKVPPVPVDPTSFGQVIHNLLENAVTYVAPHTGKVSVSFKQNATDYVLTVKDNGIGVPIADQAHIFERFYRAQNSSALDANGTGLGLYLVKLIIDACGGTITCDSTPNKGSTFTVHVPFLRAKRS